MYCMAHPGKMIETWMTARNLSEGDVSRGTKIPQPTIHRIVTGESRDPRRSNLEKIARFFGRPIEDLYGPVGETGVPSAGQRSSPRVIAVVEKLVALPPARQKLILQLIDELLNQ